MPLLRSKPLFSIATLFFLFKFIAFAGTLSIHTSLIQPAAEGDNPLSVQYQHRFSQIQKAFREHLSSNWPDTMLSSTTRYVLYAPDFKTRSIIDFESSRLIFETIAPHALAATGLIRGAFQRLRQTSLLSLFQQDPYLIGISGIFSKNQHRQTFIPAKKPFDYLFVRPSGIAHYIDANTRKIKTHNRSIGQLSLNYYRCVVPLAPKAVQLHVEHYLDMVKNSAVQGNIPEALIFSFLHTNSHYNPLSITPDLKIGMMHTSMKPHKRHGINLFIPSANIRAGAEQFTELMNKQLKGIKDNNSRLYCAIVANHAGIDALTLTFKSKTVEGAIQQINTFSSKAIYRYLTENLRFKSAREYLKYIVSRMAAYQKLLMEMEKAGA